MGRPAADHPCRERDPASQHAADPVAPRDRDQNPLGCPHVGDCAAPRSWAVTAPRVLVAHPYPDVYRADRVLLDAGLAFRDAGMRPGVVLPEPGPMTAWLDEHALSYRCVDTPVLRRSLMKAPGLSGLVRGAPRDVARVARTIAELDAELVYVNTVTLPHWVLGARRARVPVIVHAHESDAGIPRAVAATLAAPMLAADRVVAVSNA